MGIDDTQQFEVNRTQEFRRVSAARHTRRVLILVVGFSLIGLGLVLIVLPGPFTLPPVLLGLTVLSWEFPAAKRILFKIRSKIKQARKTHKASSQNR